LSQEVRAPGRRHRRPVQVAEDPAGSHHHRSAEFVGTGQDRSGAVAGKGEAEGAAVGMASSPGVPVAVSDGLETGVLGRQGVQRRVDGLLLGSDQADLDVSLRQGENLGPEHGGVGDAEQLENPSFGVVAGDDEEPGPVGRAMDVGGPDLAVETLFVRWQAVKVQLGGRRQGFDDVFQRIPIDAVPQVEQEHRDLSIREELGINVALFQIFADGIIVGEVAVVHQGLVKADEGVGSAGMPDPPAGGITLVGDPDMGFTMIQAVELGHLLGVADDFQDHQVAAVGQDEGPFLPEGGVQGLVEAETVAVDKLILGLPAGQSLQPMVRYKVVQHLFLNPGEAAQHLGRFQFQSWYFPVILDRGDHFQVMDFQVGAQELVFHLGARGGVEQGDVQQVVFVQHFLGDAQVLGHQSHGGDAAALAIASVVHLHRGRKNMSASDGDAAGKPDHPAAALFGLFLPGQGGQSGQQRPSRSQDSFGSVHPVTTDHFSRVLRGIIQMPQQIRPAHQVGDPA